MIQGFFVSGQHDFGPVENVSFAFGSLDEVGLLSCLSLPSLKLNETDLFDHECEFVSGQRHPRNTNQSQEQKHTYDKPRRSVIKVCNILYKL